jgi:uncharacterized membrane protein
MNTFKIRKLVSAGLFAALVCVATLLIAIPLPTGGFANLGDVFVILAGGMLGPIGAVSAGLGAALADLFLGYGIYAPATFVIKGGMALLVWWLTKNMKTRPAFVWVAAFLAELWMVLGYFLFELCLYAPAAAAANLLGNGAQGLVALIAAPPLFFILKKNAALQKFL